MVAVFIGCHVGGEGDSREPEDGDDDEGGAEGSEGGESCDEEHEEVAEGEDSESGEVVVFVEVAESGDYAEEGRDFVSVDGFPRFNQFFHGGWGLDFGPLVRWHGMEQLQTAGWMGCADGCVWVCGLSLAGNRRGSGGGDWSRHRGGVP